MTTAINPFATANTGTATNTSTTATKDATSMGKDDFLRLLMTQMQNQDPTKPMDDSQTMAQLAQFSSLEQMQNLNTSSIANQATNMIGKTVTWTDKDNVVQTGEVSAVKLVKGETPALQVGSLSVAVDQVTQVSSTTA